MNTKKTLADVRPGGRVRLGDQRSDLVPGIVRCAKCAFQLHRTNLYLQSGTVGAGDSKTEPCPNGCGPLWPVTWETWAREGWAEAERLHLENAALSAQPSPAGQGGLNYERMFVDACAALAEVSRELGCDPERARFEAWPQAREFEIQKDGSGEYLSEVTHGAWLAWKYLSAQPTQGGQGDALLESLVARWRNHAELIGVIDNLLCQKIANCTMRHAAELQAVLAARQPVGEVSEYLAELQAAVKLGGMEVTERADEDGRFPLMLVWEGTIKPVSPPAQAVDLGQFRPFIVEARNNAYAFIETMRKAGRDSSDAREKAALTERLLDLIDSQAVGNG